MGELPNFLAQNQSGLNFDIPVHPVQASDFAGEVDALYFVLWGLTILFTLIVAAMVTVFCLRYRKGTKVDRSNPPSHNGALELAWSVIPLFLALIVFVWGARLYADAYKVPDNAIQAYVIGKQWMWHIQHPNGRRENNELHVPVGRAVKLTMISQDVIHSFFIPAFRLKRDVLPGTYTNMWFRATRPGKYHLFCAEYCGTQHSNMIGSVYVMEEEAFQKWLEQPYEKSGVDEQPTRTLTLAEEGKEIWETNQCGNCHANESQRRGPSLVGIYGKPRQLEGGAIVTADDAYLREAIINPNKRLTAGYAPLMPEYSQLKEDQILKLIAYIKSLGAPDKAVTGGKANNVTANATAVGMRGNIR
jgi:cytochrome c oxidase subunit II